MAFHRNVNQLSKVRVTKLEICITESRVQGKNWVVSSLNLTNFMEMNRDGRVFNVENLLKSSGRKIANLMMSSKCTLGQCKCMYFASLPN